MRCSVSVLIATLASCAGSVAGPSEPKIVALGESFNLKIGESAQIAAGALQIGFETVSVDSRCPKGEQCIREGDATIRVWLQKASGPKETHELRISSQDEGALTFVGYEVKALALDPYPISGRVIARGDYHATFEVTRGTADVPDR